MSATGRQDVIDGLRELADQPDGIHHRMLLFRAARLIQLDRDTVFIDSRPHPEQERHGDQTV